jgi:hypothetical protein
MLKEALAFIEHIMDKHDKKCLANGIDDLISKFLVACP